MFIKSISEFAEVGKLAVLEGTTFVFYLARPLPRERWHWWLLNSSSRSVSPDVLSQGDLSHFQVVGQHCEAFQVAFYLNPLRTVIDPTGILSGQ